MKTCPTCGTNVHDDSPRCPECGGEWTEIGSFRPPPASAAYVAPAPFVARGRSRVGPVIAIVIGAVGFAIALAYFILASSVSDAATQRAMWLGDSGAWEEAMAIKVVSGIGMVIFGVVILLGVLRYISTSSTRQSAGVAAEPVSFVPATAAGPPTVPVAGPVDIPAPAPAAAASTSMPHPSSAMIYCPQCGTPSSAHRFCSECGRDLTSVRDALSDPSV
jgi:hypothetical protein